MNIFKINFSKLLLLCVLLFSISLSSCKDDDVNVDENPEEETPEETPEQYKKTGYVISSRVNSSAGSTVYYGYFEEKPTGAIDMTQYQSGQNIRMFTYRDGFLYARPTDGGLGVAKYAVDAQTNQIVEIGRISELSLVRSLVITDENKGYYVLSEGEYKVVMFDPETMQTTGIIDLSNAFDFPTEDGFRSYYSALMYNEVTNKLLASLYIVNDNTPVFYDAEASYVTIVDIASESFEKTITHNNAKYPVIRGTTSSIVDEEGNTYFLAQGLYGIDGQIGASAPVSSRPQILKINTNSEFEESYAFNPVNKLGLENNFFQLSTTMIYGGNNKAYAVVTATDDTSEPELLALLQKLGAGTITQTEYDQLVFLILYTPTQKWVEIDLITKSVVPVAGMPFTAGFSYPYSSQGASNNLFVQFVNEAQSGFYEINTTTNSAEEVFTLSAGGVVETFVDLSATGK
ncbi:hypothetical protein Fleli_3488 [Bernardetia litoralis DSM 6794]|uniref:DUF4374 domain-containing protein n=1 Tax=Bernardetia litoralis (strain ATCC 23117 / DSM 6794 / NBRC 15988 / NCIMB 1366 / Fx l1 / Sio-4) TaxID=880071 RepID=I4APC3_BERLS|nr:hypothetical protein [Bernardetia litoralis]AFM05808.1 hypothetical protein Fleli_3488 [Bernardetia litoralis DSM 6794]